MANELIPNTKVAEEFGIATITLWRWMKSDTLGFPQPVKINGRKFFRRDEIEAFKDRMADRIDTRTYFKRAS